MTVWDTTDVETMSFEALKSLGANEVEIEVSAMHAPMFVEAADRQEVIPVDTRDPAGGFGGVDLWFATLIPVFAAAQGLRRAGELNRAKLDPVLEELVRRVGSPRAKREKDELKRVVYTVLGLEPAA